MNQEKIGNFIQEKRKEKNLTQQELAEKLGVTNKSVSKWERGINLPDYSLFENLCKELGITINELIAGEEIETEKKEEKFNNNIIGLMKYNKRKIKSIVLKIFTFLFILIVAGYFSYKGYLLYRVKSNKVINSIVNNTEKYTINPNNCANRSLAGFYKVGFCLADDYIEEDIYTGAVLYKSESTNSKVLISHQNNTNIPLNDIYNLLNYKYSKPNMFTKSSYLNSLINISDELNKNSKYYLIKDEYRKGYIEIYTHENRVVMDINYIINDNQFHIIGIYDKDDYDEKTPFTFIDSFNIK